MVIWLITYCRKIIGERVQVIKEGIRMLVSKADAVKVFVRTDGTEKREL